jgi:hypothetical protein
MRGSSACVLLNAQNLADGSRSWTRQRRGHAQLMIDRRRFARLDGRLIRLRASNCWGRVRRRACPCDWG